VSGVSAEAIPDPIPWGARIANGIVATTKYLWLTIWPLRLSPWYSHPWFEGAPLTVAGVGGALVVLLAVTAFALARAKRTPAAIVGWLWFLGTLVPVLGLLYNGRQGMADRYAYVPHIGLFVAMVWLVADLPLWSAPGSRRVAAVATATLLLLLGGATAWQTRVWANDRTFWGYTARANHDSFIAHQALGSMMSAEGRTHEAIALYRRAVRIRPELPKMHLALGRLLARTGQLGPAAAEFRKGLALDPNSAALHAGLAQVSLAQRRRATARRHAEQTLALEPGQRDATQVLATLDAHG
jgi:tetratricopeptide (TPR) repeat protein